MADTPSALPPEPPADDLQQACERAELLLPWAANGTLDAAEQAWLDGWLASTELTHPERVAPLRAELAWLRHTAQDVRRSVPLPDPEQGLDTLLRRIASDAAAARQTPAEAARAGRAGWWGRALAWINGHGPQLAGTCAVLVIAQATTLALLGREDGGLGPLCGSTGVQEVSGTVLLNVAVKPGATEAALRELLLEVDAQIVSGPSALGLYVLRVYADAAKAAQERMRARSAVVESVSLIKCEV